MNYIKFFFTLFFSLLMISRQSQNLEHELFLKYENKLKELVFPKPINHDCIKPFSINTFKNQNTIFHFWTKSKDENEFFESQLIKLQKLQNQYQDSVRIFVITDCQEKIIKKIISNHKLEIPIVIDSTHRHIFHYDTPFSVFYDDNGTLKSMTYSTFILENEVDKHVFGNESISPEHEMIRTCKFPLKKYQFPASFNSEDLKSFSINELSTQQTVIYFWPEDDCYFCLSDLILANQLYNKYKASTLFVVISKLPQSRIQKILDNHELNIPFVIDEGHRNILPNLNPLFLIYDSNGELRTFEISAHIAEEQLESYFQEGIYKTKTP